MGKKAKGKKKGGEEEEEEEIPEEFRDLSTPMLREKIQGLQYRLVKVSKERNYMQLENDMVHRFYDITKGEVGATDSEISNKCSKMEMIERDHRTHLRVHEQKVLNLEYEHKNNRRLVQADGEDLVSAEKDSHRGKINALSSDKDELKQSGLAQQLQDQEDLKMLKVGFERNLRKLRETFETNHEHIKANYRQQVEDLKAELKLKRRVETHELEERKNQHINDLLYNHQEAFAQIKAYYNDITQDNLSLIRSLKEEIAEMKAQERENTRKMQGLTVGNRQLAEPLKQKEAVRKELEHQLKSYAKDKLALKNLSSRSVVLDGLLKDANANWRSLEEKFMRVETERNELYDKFASAVKEIKKKSEYKNVIVENKLQLLESEFAKQQESLSQLLQGSKLDPGIVENVTTRLEQTMAQKNKLITNLEYQVHQATKRYNETIDVHEAKLRKLGVPSEELGFEPIPSDVLGKMPAGMVSKTN